MLQRIQERVQGWIAWAIIALIGVTFTLFGASYYFGSKGASETMTVVGGSVITKGEFEIAYRRLKQQAKVLTAQLETQLKEQAMQELIYNHLVLDAANNEGFVISKEQAQAAIMSIPQFLEDGQFSEARFNQVLSANMYTHQSFFEQVTQGMLINQQRFMISATNFALPQEVNQFIALATEKRDYRYLQITPASFNDIVVTSDEQKAYYQAHKKQFMKKASVIIDYVELSMKALTDEVKLTDEKLKTYYDENQANYVTPARYKLKHILITAENEKALQTKLETVQAALKKGTDFNQVATRYSADLLSTNAELPWMTAGTMGPNFDKALVLLKKGELSQPIKTKQGIEIVVLIDKTAKATQPFDSVKEAIRHSLILEEAQKQFVQKSEELADLSYQNPESLTPTAKALGLKVQTSQSFTQKGLKEGVAHYPQVVQTAFSEEVLVHGDNSQPVQLNDDAVMVLRVKSHQKESIMPFDMVKEKVIERVTKDKQQAKMVSLGQTLLKVVESHQPVDPLLKENKLSWQTVKESTRQPSSVPEAINQYAFDIKRAENNKPVFDGKLLPALNRFVIVELDKVSPGDPAKMSEAEKTTIQEQLATNYGIRDYDLYVKSLMDSIKVDRKVN